ncbi:MAG: GNAT family N-acetyltransferase [Pseudobdellovibrionaceae bacterium]
MAPIIRPYEFSDFLQLEVWLPSEEPQIYWPRELLQSTLSPQGAWVLIENQKLQGIVIFNEAPPTLEILLIAIHPDSRKKGYGQKLFQELINARQCGQVWLEVHEGNSQAHGFYTSLGFQQVGRRPRYYRDGGAALLLELKR